MTPFSLAPVLDFVLTERQWPLKPALQAMAECLPAVVSAGLEFSLQGEWKPDLQQRIHTPQEFRRLLGWLGAYTPLQTHASAWTRLALLCGSWQTTGRSEELWLELDHDAGDGPPPLSLFLRIPAERADAPAVLSFIDDVVATLKLPLLPPTRAAMQCCLQAAAPAGRLSHIGFMLGRAHTPYRLIFDALPPDAIARFLTAAGWPGAVLAAERQTEQLFCHVDRIRLALTLTHEVHEQLGFECFIGQPGSRDVRWSSFLAELVRQGHCDASIRRMVLDWPAVLTPFSTRRPWPDSMMVDALAHEAGELGRLDCRISHVKVDFAARRAPKAYVGFTEIWGQGTGPASPPQAASCVRPSVAAAIEAAVDFLLAQRCQSGWWLDYAGFREGISDEWVTAYIGHALAESGVPRAQQAARRAWQLLAARGRDGWGWNYVQPADADSTAWALQLAALVGEQHSERAQAGASFLRAHMQADGCVATYLAEHYEAWLPQAVINDGWYAGHACVTAVAAACSVLGDRPVQYLRARQAADGSWHGYWWSSPCYATCHAAEALARHADPADRKGVERALSWVQRYLAHGSPSSFEVALALRVLRRAPTVKRQQLELLQQRLLDCQRADGSWAAAAALAIPNAAGEVVPALDQAALFTTATVLRALLDAGQGVSDAPV